MDTSKVQLRRVTREIDELDEEKKPTGNRVTDPNSIVSAFSYVDEKRPETMTTFVADPTRNEFEMTANQAAAAVQTGGFEVDPSSKSSTEDE